MRKWTGWKPLLLLFIILCGIVYLYLLFQVVSHENAYTPEPSDAIVVLGHSLDGADQTPGIWLQKRLEKAFALYQEGYGKNIIVAGGQGPGDRVAVAAAMNDWLVARGVPAGDILLEDQSANTGENMANTQKVADEHGIRSIIVVTNDFHLYRAMMIAGDYFEQITGAGAPVDFDIHKFLAYLKEPLSIGKYCLFQ